MRKRSMLLFFFLGVLGCGRVTVEQFEYNGKKWAVSNGAVRVVALLQEKKLVAYRFRLSGWGAALRGLVDAGNAAGVDVRPFVNDEVMVCAACRRPLSAKERFELLYAAGSVSGKTLPEAQKRCPSCGSEQFCIFLQGRTP